MLLLCCCVFQMSCGEKKSEVEINEVTVIEKTSDLAVSEELVERIYDGTKEGIEGVYRVSMDIYDAPTLPLGEVYTEMNQLANGGTRKVVELKNLVNSGEPSELKYEYGHFKVDAVAGEDGEIMDVITDLKFRDLEMQFSTVLKFGLPSFYEVNVSGQQDRVHVIILKVEKEGSE